MNELARARHAGILARWVNRIVRASAPLVVAALAVAACSSDSGAPERALTPRGTGALTATAPPVVIVRATPTPTAPATPAAAPEGPSGFPIDPAMKLGLVVGPSGSRTVRWGAGQEAEIYARLDQPSEDAERANRSGWNCRVHVEYEGQPAVDWYVPPGTPVVATVDGTATLHAITMTNAFDHHGVSREPYLGNPDRSRAPLSPFPGPGGGKGIFVRIENAGFVAEYAHLDLVQTARILPIESFLPGYGPGSDYWSLFAPMRDFRVSTPVAQWTVQRGDLVGLSGDSGYSEAPHLHYTVRRAGSQSLLCPTGEAGFPDGGWLVE